MNYPIKFDEARFVTPDKVEILYISPNQAAARYGLSVSFIRNDLMHQPGFPNILRVGRKICIPLKAFDEFMQRFEVEQKTYQLRHNA